MTPSAALARSTNLSGAWLSASRVVAHLIGTSNLRATAQNRIIRLFNCGAHGNDRVHSSHLEQFQDTRACASGNHPYAFTPQWT
jgi:hypothetical protein